MEYLNLSTFITSVATATTTTVIAIVFRWAFHLLTQNGEKMKIRSFSTELIYKMLNESDWKRNETRIVVELAFEHIYSRVLTFHEIKALIYSDTPNAAFSTYLKYRSALEFNHDKKRFKFKKGREPYWFLFRKQLPIPKSTIKGFFYYFLCAIPAALSTTLLTGDNDINIGINFLTFVLLTASLFWIPAAVFLLNGLKYQNSETEIVRDLSDRFEASN